MRSRLTAASAAAVLTLLTLAGCGANGMGDQSSAGRGEPANSAPNRDSGPAAGKAEGAKPGAPAAPGTTATDPTTGKRVTIGRARILTADLTIRAKSAGEVGSLADRAITMVEGAGGELAGDQRLQDGSRTQADVVLKVPPAKYTETLNALAKLGKELSRSAKSTDVTEEVADVASRVSSQTASVERIRKLLASARNLGEVVQLEGELSRRQADLESLKARQKALDAQTADATITLHVKAPNAATTVTKPKEKERGFLAGLDAGWSAFTAAITAVLTILGALLPFAIVIGLVLGVLWLAMRRRRQPAGDAGTAAATPSV